MRRMWLIYAALWLLYGLVIGIVGQLDLIERGRFSVGQIGMVLLSAAFAGPLLALIWPISARLEREAAGTGRMILWHIGCALLFVSLWHLWKYELLRWLQNSPRPTLYGYVWPYFFGLMMYGLIAGVFHSIHSGRTRRRQAVAASQAQTLLMRAELAALRNKLNPHFLFNTLHSIIALVRKDPQAAEAALFRFSDMLRYLLDTEKRGHDRVTLDEELGFVRDYLALESLRLGPRLQVQWQIDPKTRYLILPALSIQPLVENSIRHAFNPRKEPGLLCIGSELDPARGQWSITISDDGPGCDAASLAKSDGMGVQTVRRRLQLAYPGRADMQIRTAPGQGFAVSVCLPTGENGEGGEAGEGAHAGENREGHAS